MKTRRLSVAAPIASPRDSIWWKRLFVLMVLRLLCLIDRGNMIVVLQKDVKRVVYRVIPWSDQFAPTSTI